MTHPPTPHDFDIPKLHTESLQLRSQQFYLGTVALAGTGVSAILIPGFVVDQNKYAAVGGILIWIVMLQLLFQWSLSLRILIAIISAYLTNRQFSSWEPSFRTFREIDKNKGSNRVYRSQSRLVASAFIVYGAISTISGLCSMWAKDQYVLSWSWQYKMPLLAFAAHVGLIVWRTARLAGIDDKALETWKDVFPTGRDGTDGHRVS